MIEVAISIAIVMIGVIGVLSIHPQGWSLSMKSDHLGRAAEILREELETNEYAIMNCCSALPVTNTRTVFSSGLATQQPGDVSYTVATTVTPVVAGSSWRVTVRVTWTGNATGIAESLVVTKQEYFKAGCVACVH